MSHFYKWEITSRAPFRLIYTGNHTNRSYDTKCTYYLN